MEEKFNIKQLILFILIIMITLGLFYGITTIVLDKKNNKKVDNTEEANNDVTIDYNTILAKNILSQSQEAYYVLASFTEDSNVTEYKNTIEKYKNKENSLKVYEVDLNSAFNKAYVSDESNLTGENITFKETTLIKIENKQIKEVYEGKDEITKALSTLIGE